MARPIKADAKATRRRILRQASLMFAEQGLGQTTMRQLAREAGVSMATVHHYFGSKADLYRACNDAYFEELQTLGQQIQQAVVGAGDLSQTIDRTVRRAFAFALEHRPAVQMTVRNVVDTGELAADRRELLLPLLDTGARLVAPLVGQPPARVRMVLLSLNYLMARLVLDSEQELGRVIGVDPDQARQVAADYLVTAAHDLFGVEQTANGGADEPSEHSP